MAGKKKVILLWSASGSHDDFSALEARRNVKMVSFERRDPNLKDDIESVAVCHKFDIVILLKIIRSVVVTQ